MCIPSTSNAIRTDPPSSGDAGIPGSRSRKLVRTIERQPANSGDTFDGLQDKFQHSSADASPAGPDNHRMFWHRTRRKQSVRPDFYPLDDVKCPAMTQLSFN